MFNHSAKRLGFASAGIIMALALFSASAQAKLPQPIYFWSNIPEPVSGGFMPNPVVVRPSTFLLFEDGQWVLQDMHWTGWGSSVTHATGISSSSNDIPNAAQGKRIKTWARVTLSDPGWFQGHEVYRCFDLAVPPPASLGPHPSCLAHSGSLWILLEGAPTPPAAAPAPANTTEFVARLKGGTIGCGLAPEGQMVCQAAPNASAGSEPLVQVATLQPDGRLTKCTERLSNPRCFAGNLGDPIPSFPPGAHVMAGPFACEVLTTGVACTVAATGKGFRITPQTVESVGG